MAAQCLNVSTGVWGEIEELVEQFPMLQQLQSGLAVSMGYCRAESTLKTYLPRVKLWVEFSGRYGLEPFPVKVALFILFLQERLELAVAQRNKAGVVLNVVYAVDLVSRVKGTLEPGCNEQIQLLIVSARRQLGRPTVRKKAVGKDLLSVTILHLLPDLSCIDLGKLRVAVFLVLSFVLVARWSEVAALRADQLFDYGEHLVAFLEMTKCDQFREGSFVPFVDSQQPRGAASLVRLYLTYFVGEDMSLPLIRGVDRGRVRGQYLRPKGLYYTRMRELVRQCLTEVGENPDEYGLHGYRAGAGTHTATDDAVLDRLWAKQGGWASNCKDTYVEECENTSLVAARSLQL